jgi:hypothetical protein
MVFPDCESELFVVVCDSTVVLGAGAGAVSDIGVEDDAGAGVCTEHYASLVILNRGSARRGKPIELTEAARLNCEAVRARLTEHKRELHS